MIHPSYVELMKVVNENAEIGEEPVVNSRYSIVCATAKRARQIIDGSEPMVGYKQAEKPLSIAVDELYKGKLQILTEEEAQEAAIAEAAAIKAAEERKKEAPPLTGEETADAQPEAETEEEPPMTEEEIAEELLEVDEEDEEEAPEAAAESEEA